MTASQDGISAEIRQETRPNNHNPARSASGAPFTGPPPGPVRDRGKQEAGNGRYHEAEQHLVDMPGERIEPAWYRAPGGKHDDPQQQR